MAARIAAMRAADTQRPARWMPSRLVLQNWWYFTYQEFHFAGGRLVLNGRNGSGKSTVGAVAVPVALDMVKHRSRFDPFGGQERNPAYYLLGLPEAGVGSPGYHDARIGYVVWEFQHGATDEFMTVGVGFHAKRSDGPEPALDSWGFVLPGIRLGEDFSIVGEGGEPLTRGGLEAMVGRTQVYRTAHDYQAAVNRHLFGFDRPDDLRHLTDTLVELRKPKLDRGVTPEALSRSLESALPGLPLDVTGRLADLISRIDAAADALAITSDHVRRVERIHKEQGAYLNQWAQEAAVAVIQSATQLDRAREQRLSAEKALRETREAIDVLSARIQTFRLEQATAKGTYEVKRNSTAYRGLESLDVAAAQESKAGRAVSTAERALEAAEHAVAMVAAERARVAESFLDEIGEIQSLLDDMELSAEGGRWGTVEGRLHAVREALARASVTSSESVDLLVTALDAGGLVAESRVREEMLVAIERGLERLAQARAAVEAAEQQLRVQQGALAVAVEVVKAAEQAVDGARDDATRAIAAWSEESAGLAPTATAIGETLERIDAFRGAPHEVPTIVAPIQAALDEAVTVSRQRATDAEIEVARAKAALAPLERDRQRWEQMPAAIPPARPGQDAIRAALTTAKLRVVPFYAAVDFNAKVPPDVAARLEQALEDAGLLDALIVHPADRDAFARLLADGALPTGAADRWVLGASVNEGASGTADMPGRATPSLADALVPATEVLSAELVRDVLGLIRLESRTPSGAGAAGKTTDASVYVEGGTVYWTQGILGGRTSRESAPAPRYIGETNRRRHRAAEIARLKLAIADLVSEQEAAETHAREAHETVRAIQGRADALRRLPALNAFQSSLLELHTAERGQAHAERQVLAADQAAESARTRLRGAQSEYETSVVLVPEARAVDAAGLRTMRAAVRDTIKSLSEVRRSMPRLSRHCDTDLRYAAAVSAAEVAVEERRIAVQDAMSEAAQARALREEIERGLQGTDAATLRQEVTALLVQIEALATEIRGTELKQASLDTDAKHQVQAVTDAQTAEITREGNHRAAVLDFGQRLRAYPEEAMQHALELFETTDHGPIGAARDLLKRRRSDPEALSGNVVERLNRAFGSLSNAFNENRGELAVYRPELMDNRASFMMISDGQRLSPASFLTRLQQIEAEQGQVVQEAEHELYVNFFLQDVIVHLRRKVLEAEGFVRDLNGILGAMKISNGSHFRITWSPKPKQGQSGADYLKLVEFVKLDPEAVTPERREAMLQEFQDRIRAVREHPDGRNQDSYRERLTAEFDYRTWFEFRFFFQKPEEPEFELRGKGIQRLSGGERTLAQVLPLIAAVHARSLGGHPDGLKLIALDEAFAGVDALNTESVLRILVHLGFSWLFTGEKFWGDSRAVPACATYALTAEPGVVLSMLFLWDGRSKVTELDMRQPGHASATSPMPPKTSATDARVTGMKTERATVPSDVPQDAGHGQSGSTA